MAILITMVVSDDELSEIIKNIGTTNGKTFLKHIPGDGHHIKSQKSLYSTPGYSEIEIILDYDPRDILKKLEVLDK